MPKKKGSERKARSKQPDSKTPKKESSVVEANKTASVDQEKELYLIQLRYVSEQMERCQLTCDELQKQKKNFDSKYSALEQEKKDIADYLKQSLLEREEEVDKLAKRLESQRQAAVEERDALNVQHCQLRQELQDQIEELKAENKRLVTRLSDLEEFQKQKKQMVVNMAFLETQLSNQKEEHKAATHSLEMKMLLEKRRLEKEMQSHVAAMADGVQHQVDHKIPETTKLALQEATEAKAQISQLSEKAQILMGENSALRRHKSKLSVEVENLEQMLSKMARQSCVQKKVVEQLTKKNQQLQVELGDCRQEFQQLQTKHTGVMAETEELRQDQASLSEQCSQTRAEVSRLKAALQEERRRRSKMKRTMEEAALILKHAVEKEPTGQVSDCQWKQMMHMLLVTLEQTALTSFSNEDKQLNEMQTCDPVDARPDDHPTLKQKHTLLKTGGGFSSSRVSLHRKPFGQKTACNPTDKAASGLTSRKSGTKQK
ncbi:uncharacterized protein V6R79_022185 [Siganus canaliculatus]